MLMEATHSQDNVLDLSSRSSLSPPSRKPSLPGCYKTESDTPSISSEDPQGTTPYSPHINFSRVDSITDIKIFQDNIPQFPGFPISVSNQTAFPAALDPLSLAATAAAYQSTNSLNGLASLISMPMDAGTMSPYTAAPWSLYLNQLSSRKRKTSSQPLTKSDGESSSKQQKTEGEQKRSEDDKQEDGYLDRRRKNNEAAKRSRDARRQKEEGIAVRAAFLEQENLKLRAQVTILKNESTKLHFLLYNRSNNSNQTSNVSVSSS